MNRHVVFLCLVYSAALTAYGAEKPEELAACFRVPEQFAGQRDEFPSPLLLPDGSHVATVEAWEWRRAQIRKRWFELIGEWPPLLAAPRLETRLAETRENFEQRSVRIEIAAEQLQSAILLVPRGAGPFPAVIVPYYDAETGAGLTETPLRDFGYQMAKRGFVALCLGRPSPDGSHLGIQPLSYLAYIAANCHTALARLPEVDRRRIGIVGHSFGGKWALFASCLYDKFACAAWSDPGIVFDESRGNINYWEPWYLGFDPEVKRTRGRITAESPRTGPYKQMIAEGRNLHELHALMMPRPFLVSGGAEDPPERWKPLHHAIKVGRLYGSETRVGMHNRPGHVPTEESNAMIYRFLEHFLGSPPAAD